MKLPILRDSKDPNDLAEDLRRSLADMSDAEFSQLLESTLRRGAKFSPYDNQKLVASLHYQDKLHYEAACNSCKRLYDRLVEKVKKRDRNRIFISFFLCQTIAHLQWIRLYHVRHKLKHRKH